MDIKRINPGVPDRGPAEQSQATGEPPPTGAAEDRGPVKDAGLDSIAAPFTRTDWASGRPDVLSASINALLDRSAERLGTIPCAVRQQVADMLLNDPYFSKRLAQFLEQRLS